MVGSRGKTLVAHAIVCAAVIRLQIRGGKEGEIHGGVHCRFSVMCPRVVDPADSAKSKS